MPGQMLTQSGPLPLTVSVCHTNYLLPTAEQINTIPSSPVQSMSLLFVEVKPCCVCVLSFVGWKRGGKGISVPTPMYWPLLCHTSAKCTVCVQSDIRTKAKALRESYCTVLFSPNYPYWWICGQISNKKLQKRDANLQQRSFTVLSR